MTPKKIKNQRCLTCSGTGQVKPLFTTLNVKAICSDCSGYGYRIIFSNQQNLQKAIRVDELRNVEAYF